MKQRASQVAEELRKIISMILLDDLNDPRMGFVTVTRIDVSDDLKNAKVFYSVLGNQEQKKSTQEALEENLAFIRHLTVERINLKFAIDLKFEEDKSIDYSFKIDTILKKIKRKEDL